LFFLHDLFDVAFEKRKKLLLLLVRLLLLGVACLSSWMWRLPSLMRCARLRQSTKKWRPAAQEDKAADLALLPELWK
jgi:hypothetical protein